MSNALEKIMEDAADVLDDFQDRLKSALYAYREQNEEHYQNLHQKDA